MVDSRAEWFEMQLALEAMQETQANALASLALASRAATEPVVSSAAYTEGDPPPHALSLACAPEHAPEGEAL